MDVIFGFLKSSVWKMNLLISIKCKKILKQTCHRILDFTKLNIFLLTELLGFDTQIERSGNFADVIRINHPTNADQCIIVATNYE